jgi:hypothetical protein
MTWQYDPRVLAQLERHGLAPSPSTAPEFARECLSDLYRYEIRKLRGRLLAREFPSAEYAAHVVQLRDRYWLLSVPVAFWAAAATS